MTQDLTIDDLVKGEREFLHDISSKLAVAHGMNSMVIEELGESSKLAEKLTKSINSIDAAIEMVHKRRETLISHTP